MTSGPAGSPSEVIGALEEVLRSRLAEQPAGSYSAVLLRDPERLQRKVMEEAFEVCLELGRRAPAPERVAAEAADLLFHLLVGLVGAGVGFDAVLAELERRRPASSQSEPTPLTAAGPPAAPSSVHR